jgi:UDP-hydrolysing UDP-N-acetyl-D-glucosamine 2-epimerase
MSVRRKIAVVLVDRANYGRLKPVIAAIKNHPALELQIICAGTMLLERFGRAADVVRNDGFTVDSEIYMELEGSVPSTMAKSVGFGVVEFSTEFYRLKPDIVLIIGDRYEALAAGIAAAYMNICIAHIQGGEVSRSIDESARHCLTKLAQYHFPSTKRAAEYIERMGERKDTVFNVGCPSGDIALTLDRTLPNNVFAAGIGAKIDPKKPFLLVIVHPITTGLGSEFEETTRLIEGMEKIGQQTLWLWPNIDAGADHVSSAIRAYREKSRGQKDKTSWLRLVKNYPPDVYQKLLSNAACVIGNSSSFIRDSSFFGTPVVIVGGRQEGREVAENVAYADYATDTIVATIRKQLDHGRYTPSTLYGDGKASQRIADHLAAVPIYIQKMLDFARVS